MASTSEPPGQGAGLDGGDALVELATLVSELRHTLLRHQRAGRWAASSAATTRPAGLAAELGSPGKGSEGGVLAAAWPSTLPSTSIGASGSASPHNPQGPEFADATFEPAARPRKTLETVRAELGDCQRCKLASTRTKLVFGSGAADAALVFVGEAPGADEDRSGEPFVGRAGELLDKMIEAMGWNRSSVYIANLLKCRPPGNRNPEPDEARQCRPFLIAQLEVIAPRIIVALGRPAANALLGNDAPISSLRGRFHERFGVKIMPTFHPAYLLRQPGQKREAWADLKVVMAELERIGVAAPNPHH
jgi:uracil-DNA glycosylase